MDSKFDILHQDVQDIKADVKELLKSSAVHNQILSEHQRRSTQLEERFKPIEGAYVFASKAAILVGLLATVAGLVRTILELR